jgi:hypothetical protein
MSRFVFSSPLASGLLACTFAALFAFPWGPIWQDRCIGIDVGQPSLVSECASYVVTRAKASNERAKALATSMVIRTDATGTEPNWTDNPSVMDSSWRDWPTVTDF